MRVLITGATGFVGSHLIRRLVQTHQLYCITRRNMAELNRLGCSVIEHDLQQALDPSILPSKIDAIVHLASVNVPFPDQAFQSFSVIVDSTQRLLDYGRKAGIKRFIFVSSGSVYGFGPTPWREEDPVQLPNFYAVNKYCAELLVTSYKQFFSTCILRLFFPYGPGQVTRRIPMIIERVKHGKPVQIVNGGKPRINPIYIDDLIQILEKALTLEGHIVVNVAGDQDIDMKELAMLVGELLGKKPIFEETTDSHTLDLIGDNQLMHEIFQIDTLIPLQEGLKRTIQADPL